MDDRGDSSTAAESAGQPSFIEAINGSQLHWSDFRANVLQRFRIRCLTSAKADCLPTTFLARLQNSQNNLSKHEARRQAWRSDIEARRGFNASNIFPPNILPARGSFPSVLGCTFARFGREGLPPRDPSNKNSLYELPTAKPSYVYGFDESLFGKNEQAHLVGALHISGTVVDFENAEVSLNQPLSCPFLAFERVDNHSEQSMETAKNACAITGAQCIRGQQQLFHKAFGLQTIAQPPLTFTCALSNFQAVINCHYVDEDGYYVMGALCKFDLDNDMHFCTFQAWIEAIQGWASIYLLPRIQVAINQLMLSNPSPPPSPAPTNASHLSIDTSSENTASILNTLRRMWPMLAWRNDAVGETPINSSIAMCGTPLPARQGRRLALPNPPDGSTDIQLSSTTIDSRSHSSSSQRPSLIPLDTDILSSAYPGRQSIHARRFSSNSTIFKSYMSTTPESPCRPPSLSPCTPGPEMPMSSKSPMLVLQKRLELAMAEIQDLRSHIEDLDGRMTGRTEIMEKRLESVMERQDDFEEAVNADKGHRDRSGSKIGWVRQMEAFVEEDMPTPIAVLSSWAAKDENHPDDVPTSPISLVSQMPGYLSLSDDYDTLLFDRGPWLTEELLVWCVAMLTRNKNAKLLVVAITTAILCYLGSIDISTCIITGLISTLESSEEAILWPAYKRVMTLYDVAQVYDLTNTGAPDDICTASSVAIEEEEENVPIMLA